MNTVVISSPAHFEQFCRETPFFLADFWKDQCVNCKMLELSLQKFAATPAAATLTVAKLKLEALGEEFFRAHAIRQAPTLLLYRDSREAARASGFIPPDQIAALLAS